MQRIVHPWDEDQHPRLTRYLGSLLHRPSVARVIDDARPYRSLFPLPWPTHADDHGPAPEPTRPTDVDGAHQP